MADTPPTRRPNRFTPATAKAARARRERLRATQDNTPNDGRVTQPNDLELIARAARRAIRRKGLNARGAAELGRLLLDVWKAEAGQQGQGHKGTLPPTVAPQCDWRARIVAQAAAAREEASEDTEGAASAAVAGPEAQRPNATARTVTEAAAPSASDAKPPGPRVALAGNSWYHPRCVPPARRFPAWGY